MKIFILFGLPGTGKSYIGRIFEEYFNYYFYEGDLDLPQSLHDAIINKSTVTDEMRDEFFSNILITLSKLKSDHENIVLSQTFIKEKYRKLVLEKYKDVEFIYIKTDDKIREERLLNRTDYILDLNYARQMVKIFEIPQIKHLTLINNLNGREDIIKQLKLVLNN